MFPSFEKVMRTTIQPLFFLEQPVGALPFHIDRRRNNCTVQGWHVNLEWKHAENHSTIIRYEHEMI